MVLHIWDTEEYSKSETESRMVISGTEGAGNWELLFNGCRVSVLQDKREVDSGDGYTTIWMYLLSLSYTFEVFKIANFMCVLSQYKKKLKTISIPVGHRFSKLAIFTIFRLHFPSLPPHS